MILCFSFILWPCWAHLLAHLLGVYLYICWYFLHWQSFPLQIEVVLSLLFQSLHYLFPFLALTLRARSFSVILNRTCNSGHPCFAPDLREKVFSFPLFSRMLVVSFCRCSYQIKKLYLSGLKNFILFFWEFVLWMGVELYQMLFLHLLVWSYDFYSLVC